MLSKKTETYHKYNCGTLLQYYKLTTFTNLTQMLIDELKTI
jgi:hypothetical protein